MTRLGDSSYLSGGSSKGIVAKFSPDGTRFVVVLRRGNLEKNTNDYLLLLFETAEAFHLPTPHILVSLASSSNRPGIKNATWLGDNDTILFLGEHPGEQTQLYSVNCSSGELKRLTKHPTNLISFAVTRKGDRVVYVAETPVSNFVTESALRSGIHVTHELLLDLIKGTFGGGEYDEHEMFVLEPNPTKVIQANTYGRIDPPFSEPSLAPDGEHFVVQTEARQIPEAWNKYQDKFLKILTGHGDPDGTPTRVHQYELLDTRTGASHVLLDAPVEPNWGSEVAWSPDSQSVVLSDVYLPLNVEPAEQLARRSHTYLVEISIASRDLLKISDEDLRLVEWNSKTNLVMCEVGRIDSHAGDRGTRVYFSKVRGGWHRVGAPETPTAIPPEIVLEENIRTAPRIVAVDSASNQKSLLMDLNPQFKDLAFAQVEEVSWKGTLGNEVKGGLYWPTEYEAGRRYPLIIQTHGFTSDRFWIDGLWPTAFAAQPLAAKGFFVLQVSETDLYAFDTPDEAPRAMAAYEGAIDDLDHRGLIDRNRVGIIGFSRTCLYVTYTLTHSKYKFVAAAIADGMDGGYFQYLALSNNSPPWANEFDLVNGAPPFGDGLPLWMRRSPAFSMEKVQTPLRIQAIGASSLLTEWEWFSGLSRLKKPVDMIYIPDGAHLLEKPWERMVSQQGNVDWFCFWLKGEEDSDPGKSEQYARWYQLRSRASRMITSVDVH